MYEVGIIFIVGFVFILIGIWRIFHRGHVRVEKNTYSWLEILNIFNAEPFRLYKHLSPENKGAFWNLVSNVFICIITFWAGLTLPLYIDDKKQQETDRLAHYQIVNMFYPQHIACVDSCSSVYGVLCPLAEDLRLESTRLDSVKIDSVQYTQKLDSIKKELKLYLSDKQHLKELEKATKAMLDYSVRSIPYITNEANANSIRKNCFCLLLGGRVLSDSITWKTALKDSTRADSDSVDYVTELKNDCFLLENRIEYKTDVNGIASKFYSITKVISALRYLSFVSDSDLDVLLRFVFFPIIENRNYIAEEFFPKSERLTCHFDEKNLMLFITDIRTKAIGILVVCIFLGYMLFRVVSMRVFDRKSLRPNPQLSQNECKKLLREIDCCRRENEKNQIYEQSMLERIHALEKELQKSNTKLNDITIKRQSEMQEWTDKEKEYRDERTKLNNMNMELKTQLSLLKAELEKEHSNDGQN